MFSKLKTLKSFSNETITINNLIEIVKSNPQKEIIENIRSVEYKSIEYNNLKLKVNAITPHGIFNSLKNEGLIKLSGYLYYDIDGIDTEKELNDTIKKLIDTNFVSFICKSVGGKGISFLIKYDTNNILNDTFITIYNSVRCMLVDMGFNIDKSANGLVRKMIISSDNNLYFNEVSLSNLKGIIQTYSKDLNKSNVKKVVGERVIHIIPNDTFKEIIPYDILIKEIELETQYTNDIIDDYVIEDMDYYKIILPKNIVDGKKHSLYIRIINALYYINNNITINQIYSYLYYINKTANPPMRNDKLISLTKSICSNIVNTGDIRIKTKTKKIHFNKNLKLSKNQKQSMGAKLSAIIKNNKTIELINRAKEECIENNIIPTQNKVVEMTGISIATVKRNWKKEVNNDFDIKLENNEVQQERDYKISQLTEIDEDIFFIEQPKEKEIINYKNFKSVEIDKVSTDDKKLFISKINELKENGIEPSESIMIQLNIFDEYKTWYLYDKWRSKNEYIDYKIKE